MATWPATLPDTPLVDGYREREPKTLIRTEMDAGPPKVRRRYTAGVRPFAVKFILTSAQVATFSTFYVSTLQDGALPFDMLHPRTGATVSMRCTSEPEYEALDPGKWRVSFGLEQLP